MKRAHFSGDAEHLHLRHERTLRHLRANMNVLGERQESNRCCAHRMFADAIGSLLLRHRGARRAHSPWTGPNSRRRSHNTERLRADAYRCTVALHLNLSESGDGESVDKDRQERIDKFAECFGVAAPAHVGVGKVTILRHPYAPALSRSISSIQSSPTRAPTRSRSRPKSERIAPVRPFFLTGASSNAPNSR